MAENKAASKKRPRKSSKTLPGFDSQTINVPAKYMRELLKIVLANGRTGSSSRSTTFSSYSKDDIIAWMQSPGTSSSQKSLRQASQYLYSASMHYNRLINYYAGLYEGSYVVSPAGFTKDSDKESFRKRYQKVTTALEKMNLQKLMRQEILIALRDGAFYGVLLSDNESAFVRSVNPDYCRISSICDGSFLYQVDMSKIGRELETYPAVFTEMYSRYLETGDAWQEVPLEVSHCIKADDTILDYAIPPFAAVMPSLYSVANAEELQDDTDELRNYKLLAGKIPLDSRGKPIMDEDIARTYWAQVRDQVDDRVGVTITPFDFTTIDFDPTDGIKEVDRVSTSVANFWSSAGTSGLLHGRDNDTAGVTKLAIKNDETYVLGMVQQFERLINRYLKAGFSGRAKYKITILPITVFNKSEYLEYYKAAASFGLGKSHYAAALGIPQSDIAGLIYLEKDLVPFGELEPMKVSYTQSDNGDTKTGRPASDDTDLTPSGESTRDNDTNANR